MKEIEAEALTEITNAKEELALEKIRVKYLGRKEGIVTEALRSLKNLSLEEKKRQGPQINALKAKLEKTLEIKKRDLEEGKNKKTLDIDITRPGEKVIKERKITTGHLHPLTVLENEIKDVFRSMNFSVLEGPEIESEFYNFDALNVPPDHPAREMWDTFWIKSENAKTSKEKLLLRTHTSPMQIRYMESHEPPLQIVVPGRVFRFEATDQTHEVNFYQYEGLMVGKNISLANFKYVIETFLKRIFGKDIEFRYRPSYFPFVEPGLEIAIKFRGKWLEMMGAGMVHPNVFKAVHYNPRDYRGFAFGGGLERLAMVKYNIPDIRLFYSGDTRFTNQF